jgi:hypothetical protein
MKAMEQYGVILNGETNKGKAKRELEVESELIAW